MKPLSLLLLLLAIASPRGDEPAQFGQLSGVVTDSEGAVVVRAIILVHWAREGSDTPRGVKVGLTEDRRILTDKAGQFSTELQAGFYDVAVFATGFTPQAFKVRLKGRKETNQIVRLNVDPMECAEFCENLGSSAPYQAIRP